MRGEGGLAAADAGRSAGMEAAGVAASSLTACSSRAVAMATVVWGLETDLVMSMSVPMAPLSEQLGVQAAGMVRSRSSPTIFVALLAEAAAGRCRRLSSS